MTLNWNAIWSRQDYVWRSCAQWLRVSQSQRIIIAAVPVASSQVLLRRLPLATHSWQPRLRHSWACQSQQVCQWGCWGQLELWACCHLTSHRYGLEDSSMQDSRWWALRLVNCSWLHSPAVCTAMDTHLGPTAPLPHPSLQWPQEMDRCTGKADWISHEFFTCSAFEYCRRKRGLKRAVPVSSDMSWWMKEGWVQWVILPDWCQCFEFSAVLWRYWLSVIFKGNLPYKLRKKADGNHLF